ncbi:MAG: 4Fe-4S dicluster domain-containing protein [Planctomycetota bacterium]
MGYGFVIDQRRCIGCHACTVACKSENEVPLGDFRTWVKYTDKGTFPEVRRHFTILRCNHCDAAPCVEICPVTALSKRPDAIVDLNRDQCIGCKGCMQACPYDAIYLNEDKGVAEKCHYCAHRTELGLAPACVVVCPEQAIIAGDADNPDTEIAQLIRDEETSQRKLEKETKPRVWYIDALEESLEPGKALEPESWLWAERSAPPPPRPADFPAPDGLVTTLNVQAKPAWGWHVWVYLVTKNISAGAMILAPLAAMIGLSPGGVRDYLPEALGLFFLVVTNVLLVHDLGRPERFWKIMLQPNTKSWLVKGAWVLSAFGGLITLSLLLRWLGHDSQADLVRWINLPVAVMASGYSAWLFAQCKGRDLWIEPGLFWQLILRAALCAAGIGMLMPQKAGNLNAEIFVGLAILAGLGMVFERRRLTAEGSKAQAHAILRASFRAQYGINLIFAAAGVAQAAMFFTAGETAGRFMTLMAAALIASAALFCYERAWIRAGQAVPNS